MAVTRLCVFLWGMSAGLGYGVPKETNPFMEHLRCDRAPGNTLKGVLYYVKEGRNERLSEFTQGHVGSCEQARRAARRGRVCINRNWSYEAIDIASRDVLQRFGSDLDECTAFTKGWSPLTTQPGFVQFIDADELAFAIKNLPRVENVAIDNILHDGQTMWYDEASMVFTYQDSFGRPQGPEGLRANRVGYDVGANSSVPDIRALTEYFKHGKFKFPFAIAAGTDFQDDVHVLNFWAPPERNGDRLPVRWWKNGSHWHWVFPNGTTIGEVLTRRGPDGEMYVFEIRSRVKDSDGWTTDIFRPFAKATQMADAIRAARPQWQTTDLASLVSHLENPNTLEAAQLSSEPYRQVFPTVPGAYDYLPQTTDVDLVREFLTQRVFVSAMGKSWKTNGQLTTYAANVRSGFHIVPPNYIGGLLKTDEQSCARCHEQTGRPLGQLDGRVVLYGEIWGEDQIFTWHPFDPTNDIYSVTDGNRRVHPRLQRAGLLENRRPSGPDYIELPRPYDPDYN